MSVDLEEPLLDLEAGRGLGRRKKEKSPEDDASIVSTAFFWWLGPAVVWPAERRGFIGPEDLPVLSKMDEPVQLEREFANYYENGYSLLFSLLFALRGPMCLSGFIFLGALVGSLGAPLLLERLLVLASSPGGGGEETFVVAFGMYLCSAFSSLCIHNAWYIAQRAGLHAQVMLSGIVLKKALRLSARGKHEHPSGKVANHFAIDCSAIADKYVAPFVHWATWYSLVQFSIATWQLSRLLGWPAAVGIAAMGVCILLLAVNGNLLKMVRDELQKHQDARANATAETLRVMTAVRASGWTMSATARLLSLRANEVVALLRVELFNALSILLANLGAATVTAIAFPLLIFSLHKPLDSAVAFTSLVWVSMCQSNLRMFPNFLRGIASVNVSLQRIEAFLQAPQVQRDDLEEEDVADSVLGEGDRDVEGDRDGDVRNERRGVGLEEEKSFGLGDDLVAVVEDGEGGGCLDEAGVEMKGVVLGWMGEGGPQVVIRNGNLRCGPGLTVLYGAQGGGKSTLLAGITRECVRMDGTVHVHGRVACVEQSPWVQQRSIRDNIVFSSSFKKDWFDVVVRACALDVDVEEFENGSSTIIGDRGITLSGGQLQRLALARAVYADRDIYILDDILSANDTHTAEHLWEKVIVDLLLMRRKCVILATHHRRFANHSAVTQRFHIDNGVVRPIASIAEVDAEEDGDVVGEEGGGEVGAGDGGVEEDGSGIVSLPGEVKHGVEKGDGDDGDDEDAEKREVGLLSWKHMRRYFGACGAPTLVVVVLLVVGVVIISNVLVRWWLEWWVASQTCPNKKVTSPHYCAPFSKLLIPAPTSQNERQVMYAWVYGLMSLLGALGMAAGAYVVAFAGIQASSALHEQMLVSVFYSPLSFFDRTPIGRIQNRFQKDQSTADTMVQWALLTVARLIVQLTCTIVVLAVSSPWILLVSVATAIPALVANRGYRIVKRDSRRLRSVAQSPLIQNFREVLDGTVVIRAFGAADMFLARHRKLLGSFLRSYMIAMAADQWITVLLEQLCMLVVAAALFLVIHEAQIGTISPAAVGFTVSFALDLPGQFLWLLRNIAWCEAELVAVERMADYASLQDEAEAIFHNPDPPLHPPSHTYSRTFSTPESPHPVPRTPPPPPPPSPQPLLSFTTPWRSSGAFGSGGGGSRELDSRSSSTDLLSLSSPPSAGTLLASAFGIAVRLEGLRLKYKEDGEEVLRGVCLDIPARSKVAIVGRTGAGKSSLMGCLAALYPHEGSIRLGGDQIRELGTDRTRRLISVIPQSAALFRASVRENLVGWHTAPQSTVPPASTNCAYRLCCDGEHGCLRHLRRLPSSSRDEHLLLAGKVARIRAERRMDSHSEGRARSVWEAVRAFGHPIPEHAANPIASDAEVWAALRLVSLHTRFQSLDDEIETDGANLSSGERQLLGLARALLRRRPLYLVDEVSSAVDQRTDRAIHDTLLQLPGTVIEICHRLKHVPRFDLVVVMERGEAVEVGNPTELLRNPASKFASMMRAATGDGSGGKGE